MNSAEQHNRQWFNNNTLGSFQMVVPKWRVTTVYRLFVSGMAQKGLRIRIAAWTLYIQQPVSDSFHKGSFAAWYILGLY